MNGLVAVPVHNEYANLPRVIEALKARFPRHNLLFIDDGSTDRSHELLDAAGLSYLRHPINLGYAGVLRTAMDYVMQHDHTYVVFFDSDGQHRVEDLERIIGLHEEHGHDLILGSRYLDEPTAEWSLRSFTTRMFSVLTSRLAGTHVTDVTCGLKLISRRFIPVAMQIPIEDLHSELIVGLARCGARIHEEKIVIPPREAGESMYNLYKTIFYPARTLLCLLGIIVFARGLRADMPEAMSDPAAPNRGGKP